MAHGSAPHRGERARWLVRDSFVQQQQLHDEPGGNIFAEVADGTSAGVVLETLIRQSVDPADEEAEHGEEEEEESSDSEVIPTHAVFDAQLLDLFELARCAIQSEAERDAAQAEANPATTTSRADDYPQDPDLLHLHRPWVLLLTAYTRAELQERIRVERQEWQHALAAHRLAAAAAAKAEADASAVSYLRLMEDVHIRYLPRPEHLFSLLALVRPHIPISGGGSSSALAEQLSRKLTMQHHPNPSAGGPASNLAPPAGPAGASAGPTVQLTSVPASEHSALLSPRAPCLVVLHGPSAWLLRTGIGTGVGDAPASLEQLSSALAHASFFCNHVARALDPRGAGTPGGVPPLVLFELRGGRGGSEAGADEREREKEARALVQEVADRFCDKLVFYQEAEHVA